MGFLSFHETYYMQALKRLEGRALSKDELYEAKQLLKLLDDLLDEGYPLLSSALEEKCRGVSRLRAILEAHGETPFPLRNEGLPRIEYGEAETEIEAVCGQLAKRVRKGAAPADEPFLADLRGYCRWLPKAADTAYVFLLRDAFLPYLYFRQSGQGNLHPWVLNRDFLTRIAGAGADDRLRLPIYEALEAGVSDEGEFAAFCKPRIRQVLSEHPALEQALLGLLCGVQAEKILVVESGYCGTVPLTLAALDDRVDFRLYTTAPYLYGVYREKIYCRRYEQIRAFETLYAQDALMKFSDFRNGRFYVRTAADEEIWKKAAGEAAAVAFGR